MARKIADEPEQPCCLLPLSRSWLTIAEARPFEWGPGLRPGHRRPPYFDAARSAACAAASRAIGTRYGEQLT